MRRSEKRKLQAVEQELNTASLKFSADADDWHGGMRAMVRGRLIIAELLEDYVAIRHFKEVLERYTVLDDATVIDIRTLFQVPR
jgi:hypothetical protein